MKAILISIKPKYVADILNGKKTIEIRKKFPKDFVGWVYIYCTKNGNDCYGMPTDLVDYRGCAIYNKFKLMPKGEKVTTDDNQPILNGKVVAKFTLNKVETTVDYVKNHEDNALLKNSCLDVNEFMNYLGNKPYGYAWHIDNLVVFDKPEEIKEFNAYCKKSGMECLHCKHYWTDDSAGYSIPMCSKPLTRAPQSWCYVEV